MTDAAPSSDAIQAPLTLPEYLLPITAIHMNKREANERALSDYDRAIGKFCSPQWVHGQKSNQPESIENQLRTLIVQVEPTPIDEILNWIGDDLLPKWQVRIHRDPGQRLKGVRLTHIRGCCYRLGKAGSLGPYWPMYAQSFQVYRH